MKNILKVTAILLILAGSFACERNNELSEVSFNDYSLFETTCNWVYFENNKVIIVNSQSELENYITCDNNFPPFIDFDKTSLIIVKGVAEGGIASLAKKILQISALEYQLNIDITLDFTAIAGEPWVISILTDKLHSDVVLSLNINQHH